MSINNELLGIYQSILFLPCKEKLLFFVVCFLSCCAQKTEFTAVVKRVTIAPAGQQSCNRPGSRTPNLLIATAIN